MFESVQGNKVEGVSTDIQSKTELMKILSKIICVNSSKEFKLFL